MTLSIRTAVIFVAGWFAGVAGSAGPPKTPCFETDILPIFKAHCVKCHGASEPKSGLDLRTRESLLKGGNTGTDLKPGSLRDSLLWQFVATDKMPAEGDKLTDAQKDVVRRWILAGAPSQDSEVVQGKATNREDSLKKRGVEEMALLIDERVKGKLLAAKVPAAPRADDAEFLRRVSLDLTGKIPTLERTLAFLDDKTPDKRRKLIDELLASPDYGRHFAVIWHKLLIATTAEKYRNLNHDGFRGWFADGLNKGRGWNEIVHDLLTPVGYVPSGKKSPNEKNKTNAPEMPQGVYLMSFEVDRRIQPKLIAANSSRLFLGQSIECAQCHNHPMARWDRADFWGVAAFFDRVRTGGKANVLEELDSGKEQVFEQKGADRKYVIPAIQPKPVIDMENAVEVRTGKLVPARFLGGDLLDSNTKGPYRPVYAKWATAADNPYFARAAVNRWWSHFLGRGFVEPVDDLSEDNMPSHPELLSELARELAASGFDLKHLIRCVCNSETYQRTSVPLAANVADKTLCSHQLPRQLTAEVLFDSLQVLTPDFEKAGKKASDGERAREEFLSVLDEGDGSPTEFSRGLQQALRLMNGDGRSFGGAAVGRILNPKGTAEENVERIYLAVLSRLPDAKERERMVKYVSRGGSASTERLGDVFWVLINSGEFIINH